MDGYSFEPRLETQLPLEATCTRGIDTALKRGGRKNAAVQRRAWSDYRRRERERVGGREGGRERWYGRMDGPRVDGPTVLTLHECADAGATACVTRPTKSKRETWAQPYWPLSITSLSSNFPLLPPEPPPLSLSHPDDCSVAEEKEVTISPIGYFCFPSEQPARFHPIYLNSKRTRLMEREREKEGGELKARPIKRIGGCSMKDRSFGRNRISGVGGGWLRMKNKVVMGRPLSPGGGGYLNQN